MSGSIDPPCWESCLTVRMYFAVWIFSIQGSGDLLSIDVGNRQSIWCANYDRSSADLIAVNRAGFSG